MNNNDDTLLSAASSILSEARKSNPTFPQEEAKVIEGLLEKHIRKARIPRAMSEIIKVIEEWMLIAPNDGTISVSYGFTSVKESPTDLSIHHGGNMGNTLKNVDANLKAMEYPSISQLKKMFPKFSEHGSPDYSYDISFKKGKGAEFIGKQYL